MPARGGKAHAGAPSPLGASRRAPGHDGFENEGIPEARQIHGEKHGIARFDRYRVLDARPFEPEVDEPRVEGDAAFPR